MRLRELMDERVRIWRVDFVWMWERVLEARVADGRRARLGRERVVRVYDVPYSGMDVLVEVLVVLL
jgi:hypothetical protein